MFPLNRAISLVSELAVSNVRLVIRVDSLVNPEVFIVSLNLLHGLANDKGSNDADGNPVAVVLEYKASS